MDVLSDTIIIAGVSCLALLWVACVVLMMQAAWDTIGEYILSLIKKLRKKFIR